MTNHLFDGLLGDADRDALFAHIPAKPNGAEKDRWYTYAHVHDVSARFAAVLQGWGVEPGDRVAVQVPKSVEALMLYLGVVRAGGVFLPLNVAYTPAEVEYFLGDAEPRVFVCDPKDRDAYAPLAERMGTRLETLGVWRSPDESAGTLSDAGLGADPGGFASVERASDDLAAILYTSGTTGRSKGAMLTHDNLLSNARSLRKEWRFTAEDRLLHALPIFHTHGLFVACNTTMLAGGSLIWLPGFDADAVIDLLPEATSMMGVPTFYTRLLGRDDFTKDICANMRLFTSGSAPLLAETHKAFEARTGHRILERYGMTETNMNTSNPYDAERRAGTVGFPLPGVELRIVGEDGDALPQGEIGTIEVRGPNVCKGYWRMPEKTKEEMREDGFFVTGDLGQIDRDGYVSIVGRDKDLIISGGYNVYPKEVEGEIDAIDGVDESAVIGVPHPDFGEGVVAVVVPQDGASLEEDAILGALKDKVAKFKQPKRVFFADELPRNTMGKVQKAELRDRHEGTFAG